MWNKGRIKLDASPIRVLVVEDDPADAQLIERQLSTLAAGDVRIFHHVRLADAIGRMNDETFDLVILDLTLPDSDGPEAVDRILATDASSPIVVLTGHEDAELAVETIRRGAQEYLIKGQFDDRVLIAALRHALERQRLTDKLRDARQGDILAEVSSELGEPIESIRSLLATLQSGAPSEDQTRQLGEIERAVAQIEAAIVAVAKRESTPTA